MSNAALNPLVAEAVTAMASAGYWEGEITDADFEPFASKDRPEPVAGTYAEKVERDLREPEERERERRERERRENENRNLFTRYFRSDAAWWRHLHKAKSVVGINADGVVVCAYQSVREAAECGFAGTSGIRESIRTGSRHRGLLWGFLVDGQIFRAKPKPDRRAVLMHGDKLTTFDKLIAEHGCTRRQVDWALSRGVFRGKALSRLKAMVACG